MNVREELKKIEDAAQSVELWLYTHNKEVDAKRLEMYALLRRIADIQEENAKNTSKSPKKDEKNGKKAKEDKV